ncbi:relaxase domain-containing protein [Patescibacteria group bacterium]|nr:relaxase domain-containing protein [Patescibacteria group bacterium]
MLARPKITAASNARNYFEMDTYYINNEFEQGSFYGKLTEDLQLNDFNLKNFDSLLKAIHPQTGQQLLKLKNTDLDQNGDRKRAACDLTFAADKSVSILYEVSDKEIKKQIREAFTKSIDKALDFAEANYSFANIGNGTKGKLAQSKMIFARFDHSESRNNDMHLHQHCLAINLIQDQNGQYRSIEFNQIMSNHQLIGQIQRNAFARKLQEIGYEIEITDAKQGTFSLKSVDKDLRSQFSSRSKDIKNEMKASGQISYKATHIAQKQTAKWKDKNKDREAIQETNIEHLQEAGADIEAIKVTNKEQHIREMDASTAIQIAITDITDQKSVFSREDILKHALKLTLTTQGADLESLQVAFEQYTELVTIDKDKNQYSTQEVLEKEREIFSQNQNHTFSITTESKKIEGAIKDFETEKGFELKAGQNDLAYTILSSNKQFIIAQGVAGAGKSTSLEIVCNVCEAENRRIVALAPTGTATDNLSKEAKIKESYTVAKFIQENGSDIKDAVVIVDEAGMMGLRDTYALIDIAIENNCKVIFSGDKNQKKSIGAGDIFPSMQRQGFETVILDEGNRQKTDQMRQVVKKILDEDIIGAFNLLKDTTQEITDNKERLAAAQEEYLKDRHNTLLITTTNADRCSLNASIRDHLVATEEITSSKEFTTRETPSLSAIEKRSALYYKVGQSIYLSKNIGSISAGREAEIKGIDINTNTLTIEHKNSKGKTFTETVNLSIHGVDLNQFVETKAALGIGEQIISKKNDTKIGVKNGQIGIVTGIKGETLTVDFGDKNIKQINLRSYPYIQHAYAITDFASQGKTTNKALAVANSQSASFNDFYTQITRAKYEAHIITDNIEELRWRAAQESVKLNATELYQNKGLKDENQYSTGQCQAALYQSSYRETGRSQETESRDNMRILSSIPLALDAKLTSLLLPANELAKLVARNIHRAFHQLRRSGTSDLTNDTESKLNVVDRLIKNAKSREQHQSKEQIWSL